MSACSNTLRALSRSRIPTHKTLLPFLYQTATIQQWKPAAQPIARRNISRYSPKDEPAPTEDVPFEDQGNLPPALEDLESPRKTTITGSERAAFEKLYRKFNTRGSRQQEKDHEVEIDAIADEYWEPDEEEDPEGNLDKIFDEALRKGAAASREWNRSSNEQLRSKKPKEDLASMAQHVLRRTSPAELKARDSRLKRREDANASASKLKKARLAERERIDTLLTSAKTDRELWETLHWEVFDRVRALDLDSTASKKRDSKPRTSKTPSTIPAPTDPKTLFANYPHHLLTALTTLRTAFPASQLPLALLPTIKSLGRSSYALGATTALYTLLLRTAWLQQSSYALITSLLTDMHNGAVEFSPEVLSVLDAVVKEFDMARSGRLGREMQMVYGMEQFGEGIREVRRWRAIVAERVGVEDGRREKGTVPVARRRREGKDPEHVPLVEGVNGLGESPDERAQHGRVGLEDEVVSGPPVHDVDPGVEFGFLGDDAGEVSRASEPNGEPSKRSVEVDQAHDAAEKLRSEVHDDLQEEQEKPANDSSAAAKTSTGEPVPWTPS